MKVARTLRPERALVIACSPAEDRLLQGLGTEPALLELAGKPVAQRVVEQAVSLGARRIDVVLGDVAAPYVAALGDGERWGCTIAYHYLRVGDRPFAALARLLSAEVASLVLHADRLLPADTEPHAATVAFAHGAEGTVLAWGCVTGSVLAACMADAPSLASLERALLAHPANTRVPAAAMTRVDSAAGLLAAMRALLAHPAPPIGIARTPAAPGVWIGNACRVHPTATLVAPVHLGDRVLVGPGAVVGPDAVIGSRSIVEAGAGVAGAIVSADSYVGPGVELRESLLSGSTLVNVRLGVSLELPDRELAGPAAGDARPLGPGVAERAAAAILWAALWPARALAPARAPLAAEHPEEAIAQGVPGAWLWHFRERFHPGLAAVLRGRSRIAGPSPRGPGATGPAGAWLALRRRSLPGLVNDALLLGQDGADPAIRFAADVLAAKKLHTRHIAGVVLRYARTVWADRRRVAAIGHA